MNLVSQRPAERGAIVTTVLVFVAMAMVLITAAVVMVITNSQENAAVPQSLRTRYLAESGVENALLRLLRNPFYTGETLTIDGQPVIITVSGTDTKIIRSESQLGDFTSIIEVTANYDSGVLTPTAWEER